MYKTILVLCISLTSFADRIYFSDTVTVVVNNDDDARIAKMDSLWVLEKLSAQQLQVDSSRLASLNYSSDSVPIFSDSLIQNRLSNLDNYTPFKLAYNRAVQTQINVYSKTYRNHISRMLGKAKFYFPLFLYALKIIEKLTSNGKDIYLESFSANNELSSARFKAFKISGDSTYDKDVFRFFQLGQTPKDIAYDVFQEFRSIAVLPEYSNQYEMFYSSGTRSVASDSYSEDLGMLAPIWLKDQMPNYFVIFKYI